MELQSSIGFICIALRRDEYLHCNVDIAIIGNINLRQDIFLGNINLRQGICWFVAVLGLNGTVTDLIELDQRRNQGRLLIKTSAKIFFVFYISSCLINASLHYISKFQNNKPIQSQTLFWEKKHT
jgi:hypothetical protein